MFNFESWKLCEECLVNPKLWTYTEFIIREFISMIVVLWLCYWIVLILGLSIELTDNSINFVVNGL